MQLVDFLRWDIPASPAYQARAQQKSEECLRTVLSSIRRHTPDTWETINAEAGALPAPCLQRLATAPELEFQMREARVNGPNSLIAFVQNGLYAERRRIASASKEDRKGVRIWTAPGDFAFGPNLGQVYESPRVGPGIPVDVQSPYGRGDIANRFPEHCGYGPEEVAPLYQKISEAWQLLDAAGPALGRCLGGFTRVIVPVKVARLGMHFGSFSTAAFPGRTVLINPDSPRMHVTALAAALLHEAIQFVVSVSEVDGRLLAAGRHPRRHVNSPWTDSSISLQSLLDAYFAWYGMFWFWTRIREAGRLSEPECSRLISQCARGFAPPLVAVVGEDALQAVHPFAREVVDGLRLVVAATPLYA